MSEQIIDGGPAFPQPDHFVENSDGRVVARWCMQDSGMTLRDWFAGQALTGLLSGPAEEGAMTPDRKAVVAYQFADAMIAARGGAK